jgi:hypothetical protein
MPSAQSMPDASPAKWHLAHTTWFFETFVLRDHLPGYRAFDDRYAYLFNSYYEAEGPRHARPHRGLLTRPSLDEVCVWRAHVDAAVQTALPDLPPAAQRTRRPSASITSSSIRNCCSPTSSISSRKIRSVPAAWDERCNRE